MGRLICNCGNYVYADMKECPNCGIIVAKMIENRTKKLVEERDMHLNLEAEKLKLEALKSKKEKRKLKFKNLILMKIIPTTITLFVFSLCFYLLLHDQYSAIKKHIETRALDPYSLKYEFFSDVYETIDPGSKEAARNPPYKNCKMAFVKYRAKNAFGAYIICQELYIWNSLGIRDIIDLRDKGTYDVANAIRKAQGHKFSIFGFNIE